MKCIKCGKNEAEIGYLCKKCFNDEHELFKIKNFQMYICPICGRYKLKEWKMSDDPIRSAVIEKIKPLGKIVDIKTTSRKKSGRYFVTVEAKGYIEPNDLLKTERKEIEIKIKKIMCPLCVKKSGNYHEAVIQVRGRNKEKLMRVILATEEMRENVAKIKNLKEGYDILVVDKKVAEERIKNLKGLSITKSFKLVGSKKGKPLYRNYYAVRWSDGRTNNKSKVAKRR